MILVNGCFIIVGIGGNTVGHFKEVVGIAVHICFRRGRKADHQGIEILKNRPVFLENAPVAFVNDDQIKMRRCKQLAAIFGFRVINGVQNSWIGRKHDSGIPIILVGTQIAQGQIRQIILKVVLRLLHQGGAVSQEKNIGNPLAAAEHIGQAGGSPCFPRTGCHHQQMLAKPLFNLPANSPYGLLLVIAVCNFIINGKVHQIQPFVPAVHQLLQIFLTEHAADLALRAGSVIPEIGFKSIGGKHHRTAAKFPLQTVCV